MDIERYTGVVIALMLVVAGLLVLGIAAQAGSWLGSGFGALLAVVGGLLTWREWLVAQLPRSNFTGRPIRQDRHPQMHEPGTRAWPNNGENPRR